MADIIKINWSEADGTVADVNDIQPIADKVDEVIDRVNSMYTELVNARGTYADLDTRLDANESNVSTNTTNIATNTTNISNIQAELLAGYNCKGEFVPGTTTASKWDVWRYDDKFWISIEDSNTETPSTSTWDSLNEYWTSGGTIDGGSA